MSFFHRGMTGARNVILKENQTDTHAMMASSLPKHVIIQSNQNNKYLRFNKENPEVPEAVRFVGDYSFGVDTRFEVKQATTGNGFIHIKCLQTSKYLCLHEENGGSRIHPASSIFGSMGSNEKSDSGWIAATAINPEETRSVKSCTLFQPVFLYSGDTSVLRLRHANTNRYVEFFHGSGNADAQLALKEPGAGRTTAEEFTFIDSRSVAVLPSLIRIKGNNKKHLKAWDDGVLDFKAEADNSSLFDFEVLPSRDGGVCLRSTHSGRYWTAALDTWVTLEEVPAHDVSTVFLPKKRGDNSMMFRSLKNGMVCKIHTSGDNRDRLATVFTYPDEASYMQIEEPFISRAIENVRYRISEMKRTEEKTVAVIEDHTSHGHEGSTLTSVLNLKSSVTNTTDLKTNVTVTVGGSVTINAGVPLVAEAGVEVSGEISGSWNTVSSKEETIEVGSVKTITMETPGRVKGTLFEKRFSYDIPFSYTLRDVLTDGRTKLTKMDDGIFSGSNGYSYWYEVVDYVSDGEDDGNHRAV